ncbi:hypothetical protein K1T71_015229 [Dendrolimus kikuchii]|nr:hypothetical protein K1T71_015229 [Dendrolimus kikuchii]
MSTVPDIEQGCPGTSETPTQTDPIRDELCEQNCEKKSRNVSFPDDGELVTQYFEPANPWQHESNLAIDGDLMDLLISPPSFNPDEIITTSPNTLDPNDDLMSLSDIIENYRGEPGNEVVDFPEQVLEPPLLPNDQLDANRIDLPEHTSELPISPNTASNVDRPNLPECVQSSQPIPDVHTDIDRMPSTSSCPDLPVDD